MPCEIQKVGADEATAPQGGRARNALLAVADDDTAPMKLHNETLAAILGSHSTIDP